MLRCSKEAGRDYSVPELAVYDQAEQKTGDEREEHCGVDFHSSTRINPPAQCERRGTGLTF